MIPGTLKLWSLGFVLLVPITPRFNSCPASTWYQSKTPIPTPAITPTKPENKDSQPNPMTKINFIYLPHEICAATKATAKAIIPSNIPTQTKPVVKPTIPLRALLWIYPQQHTITRNPQIKTHPTQNHPRVTTQNQNFPKYSKTTLTHNPLTNIHLQNTVTHNP